MGGWSQVVQWKGQGRDRPMEAAATLPEKESPLWTFPAAAAARAADDKSTRLTSSLDIVGSPSSTSSCSPLSRCSSQKASVRFWPLPLHTLYTAAASPAEETATPSPPEPPTRGVREGDGQRANFQRESDRIRGQAFGRPSSSSNSVRERGKSAHSFKVSSSSCGRTEWWCQESLSSLPPSPGP